VRAHGARFAVMTLSPGLGSNPDVSYRRATLAKLGLADLLYPDRRVKSVGLKEGFPVIVSGPLFQAEADRRHVFFHGFPNARMGVGHWNEEGHELAAVVLSDALTRLQTTDWADDQAAP
jgi:hypothetical protein